MEKNRGLTPTPISKKIGVSSQDERGLIKNIILIIIGLALLKYFFDWSIFDAVESEQGRETIAYIRMVLDTLWSYLETPLAYVWNEVLWPAISQLLSNLGKQ